MKIYLDSSDLFRAIAPGELAKPDPHNLELFEIITCAAQHHQFCFSFNHLSDLCAGDDIDHIVVRAKWIDQIPNKIWLKSHSEVRRLEILHYLKGKSSGQFIEPDVYTSFLGMFGGLSVEETPNALRSPTVEAFAREICGSRDGREQFQKLRAASSHSAKTLSLDRDVAIANQPRTVIDNYTRFKANEDIFEAAKKAHSLLINNQDKDYFDHRGTLSLPRDLDWLKQQSYEAVDHPKECKQLSMMQSITNRYADELAKEDSAGTKFERKHRSDYDDFGHLTGACYCDIFSCDGRTSRYLGDYRETKLSLTRQLSAQDLGKKEFNFRLKNLLVKK